MNNPNNILWVLGTNGLSFLMEQERKHWLLKADKNKEVQDDITGDLFHGQLDNQGSRIILESSKTPKKTNVLSEISFVDSGLNDILSPAYSAFTYNTSVNGLLFARIESIGYMLSDAMREKNYRLEFTNAEEVIIPFAASHVSGDVYATKWIKTTIAPKMLFVGTTETRTMTFAPNVTGVTYYYPLDSSMHVLNIENTASMTYTTEVVNNSEYIGYPLFWFTCDNSNTGPTTTITNNKSVAGKTLLHIGNAGNDSPYVAKGYFGIDGNMDATPDDGSTSTYWIRVYPKEGTTFANAQSDYDMAIDPSKIELFNSANGESHMISIDTTNISKITMDDTIFWDFEGVVYEIPLLVYDSNCYTVARQALQPALKIYFDTNIPFTTSIDNDMGYAGIEMSSALSSDQSPYPYDLHKWDGIPEHLQNSGDDRTVPQHVTLYAMHNTPFYSPDSPESRQTAALLLDPGKPADNNTGVLDNDERGRVYLLSNDDPIYENNATLEHPKPARTVARICDIPTSVTQFMNVHGIAPVSVVDKNYVRSEVSFTNEDIERLYNTLGNTMVKPTMYDTKNNKIYDPENSNTAYPDQKNKFIFASLDYLKAVDLLDEANDLRRYENLSPTVAVENIVVHRIAVGGEKYTVGDLGMTIIGGSALEYVVEEVSTGGRATKVSIHGIEENQKIHLSNFNLADTVNGVTAPFGTARSTGIGAGLKIEFEIDNYSEIKTKLGIIKDELFALVEEADGLYLYTYIVNKDRVYGDEGEWVKQHVISKYDNSTSDKTKGGASVTDAYLNTTIPSFKPIEVLSDNGTDILKTISTGTMINIIDTEHTPLRVAGDQDDTNKKYVDMCGWVVTPLRKATSERYKDDASVIDYIKKYKLGIFDSYMLWRWENNNDTMNKNFEYCFAYRKLNNYLNTDSTTLIPMNNLIHNSYVNTNPNTTIVWDVPQVGVMMWVYSPSYKRHETYHLDQETRDLRIGYADEIPGKKSELRWSDMFVKDINGDMVGVTDGDGLLRFNILTNSMVDNASNINVADRENIYDQSDYTRLDGKRTFLLNESEVSGPRGNWRLVFPNVNVYTIQNEGSGINNIGMKLRLMDVTKTHDINFDKTPIEVSDSNGNRVNSKCVILNETQFGTEMMIYNNTLGKWVKA